MSGYPQETENVQVKDGVDPKTILRERGAAYDGRGFLPDMPDYLGYLLSLLLLWLVYTGYKSVTEIIKDPDSMLRFINRKVEQTLDPEAAKNSTAKPNSNSDQLQEELPVDGVIVSESGNEGIKDQRSFLRRWVNLDNINDVIDRAISYTGNTIDGLFSDDMDNISEPSSSTRTPLAKDTKGEQAKDPNSVEYEYFR